MNEAVFCFPKNFLGLYYWKLIHVYWIQNNMLHVSHAFSFFLLYFYQMHVVLYYNFENCTLYGNCLLLKRAIWFLSWFFCKYCKDPLLSKTFNSIYILISRNLPEVRSAHDVLGIPTVSARFGTAPFFWNWGMSAMTNLLSPVCSHLISIIEITNTTNS